VSTSLSEMKPNPKLDSSQKGLYQGTVATNDISFHEKITINMANDGSYNAIIKVQDGQAHIFTGKPLDRIGTIIFEGTLGSFKVKLDNPANSINAGQESDLSVSIFDAVMHDQEASITAFKDFSTQRTSTSLGSFTSNDGSITGTWDFTFVSGGPGSLGFTIPTLTLVRDGGSIFVLNITGNYQRLCSAPGTPVPIGVVNSSFFNLQSSNSSNEIAGATLNYTIAANRLEATNAGCRDFPSANLDITIANWTWNGIQGTATIDTSSLPDFSGI